MHTDSKTASASAVSDPQKAFHFKRYARANSTQLGILGVFVALWIIFIIAAPQTFLRGQIYYAFMSTVPFFAMMAIPLTIIVIAAEMDLSFPSIMAMGMVAFLLTYDATSALADVPLQVFLGFCAALLAGTAIGWLNGFIIVKFGIPSLVATIGTQFFCGAPSLCYPRARVER